MSAKATQTDAGTEIETMIADSLWITDSGGTLPLDTHNKAHVFEDAEGAALCGHPSTASHQRQMVGDASHDHNPIGSNRVCGNCTRAVRSKVAAGELSTGDDTLDLLLRAEAGDEIRVETEEETQTMIVEKTYYRHGRIQVDGVATDLDDADIEWPTEKMNLSVRPGAELEAKMAGSLLDERDRTDVTVTPPIVTDGGVAAAEQSTIAAHAGWELVEYERSDDPDDFGVYCPDCGDYVAASKGSHEAPENCEADRVWGWRCDDCKNVFPSNACGESAPGFNDQITAVRATPRGGEQRWIPVPVSAVDD